MIVKYKHYSEEKEKKEKKLSKKEKAALVASGSGIGLGIAGALYNKKQKKKYLDLNDSFLKYNKINLNDQDSKFNRKEVLRKYKEGSFLDILKEKRAFKKNIEERFREKDNDYLDWLETKSLEQDNYRHLNRPEALYKSSSPKLKGKIGRTVSKAGLAAAAAGLGYLGYKKYKSHKKDKEKKE